MIRQSLSVGSFILIWMERISVQKDWVCTCNVVKCSCDRSTLNINQSQRNNGLKSAYFVPSMSSYSCTTSIHSLLLSASQTLCTAPCNLKTDNPLRLQCSSCIRNELEIPSVSSRLSDSNTTIAKVIRMPSPMLEEISWIQIDARTCRKSLGAPRITCSARKSERMFGAVEG